MKKCNYRGNWFFSSSIANHKIWRDVNEKAFVSSEGKEEAQIDSVQELLTFFMDRAKKGQYIQRYKGLGEMNPEQLWSTTMNPEFRTLQVVTVDDAAAADRIFSTLMGDSVEPRRKFIERNARYATIDA